MPPSHVWQFFKKKENGKKARCCICTKELSFCGSTTSLSLHLQKTHDISTKKIEEIELSDDDGVPSASKNKKIENFFKKSNMEETSGNKDDACMSENSEKTVNNSSPIVKLFKNASAYSRDGERTTQINDTLLYMIAVDNMPLSVVEKRGFKKFCKILQPLYKAPCIKTRKVMFDAKYASIKEKVMMKLENCNNIVLTTDLWTETMQVKTFLGITAHYIEGTELKSVDIGAKQVTERKTISNLKCAIMSICNEWKIKTSNVSAIVTDNGANVVGACKAIFAERHVRCFAHTLNIVAINSIDFYTIDASAGLPDCEDTDEEDLMSETGPSQLKDLVRKIKKIVCFFKRSEAASTTLTNVQKESGKQPKRLIQEVKTRWNSLYEMVERYLELSEFVSRSLRKVIAEKSSKMKPPPDITLDEIEILTEVKDILKPMFMVTKEICSENNVTISKVIPLIKLLKKNLENILPVEDAAYNLRKQILFNILEKFKNIEQNPIYSIATILDPRYKKLHFDSDETVEAAVALIEKRIANSALLNDNEEPPSKKTRDRENSLWTIHDEMVECQNSQPESDISARLPVELIQYLNRPVCSRTANPIEEWESYKHLYPNLYVVAREYLGILATSVPSERLFSKAGLIITQRRNRLSSENLNQQLFLQNISEQDWFN